VEDTELDKFEETPKNVQEETLQEETPKNVQEEETPKKETSEEETHVEGKNISKLISRFKRGAKSERKTSQRASVLRLQNSGTIRRRVSNTLERLGIAEPDAEVEPPTQERRDVQEAPPPPPTQDKRRKSKRASVLRLQGSVNVRRRVSNTLELLGLAETGEEQPPSETQAPTRKKSLARLRSLDLSPKCPVCNKRVYSMEKVCDSSDRGFHAACLKCQDCPKNLSGHQVFIEETESGKKLYCKKHWKLKDVDKDDIVRGWRPDTSHINDGGEFEDDVQGARTSLKKRLSMTFGRSLTCSRCGFEIEDKDFQVSGMERFHLECPDKDSVQSNPRRAILSALQVFPVVLSPDPKSKRGHTFLFVLDHNSKENALCQKPNEKASLYYDPDTKSRSSFERQVETDNQVLSMNDCKKTFTLEENPNTGEPAYTTHDPQKNTLVSKVYKVEKGVLFTLQATLSYDYNQDNGTAKVKPEGLTLTFESLNEH